MTTSPPADALPELPVVAWIDSEVAQKLKHTRSYVGSIYREKTYADDVAVVFYYAALTYGRQCADARAESLRAEVARLQAFADKVHEINENGLYREEIVFEGTGRYAVDIDAVDELGHLCAALKEQA